MFITTAALSRVCAQDTIRMMQYNLMYYTNTSGVSDCNSMTNNLDNKDLHIKTIFQYVRPTVFCVCEIGSQTQYADRLLNNAINTDGIDYYRRGPLTNQSGGTIANMIYYDSRKLVLYKSTNITTSYRDINGYTFYYNADNLSSGDTIFTTFWIAHLKAGTGTTNENARFAQTQKLMNRIANSGLPGNYTFSGDFNLYSSNEAAYQELTEYSNSLYRFYDPVNSPGYWHNSSQFSSLHTQSTRTQAEYCFSTGGLDDRFGCEVQRIHRFAHQLFNSLQRGQCPLPAVGSSAGDHGHDHRRACRCGGPESRLFRPGDQSRPRNAAGGCAEHGGGTLQH